MKGGRREEWSRPVWWEPEVRCNMNCILVVGVMGHGGSLDKFRGIHIYPHFNKGD